MGVDNSAVICKKRIVSTYIHQLRRGERKMKSPNEEIQFDHNISLTDKVVVEVKSVYGNDLIYPVSKNAKQFAMIAGTKTLSPHVITIIKSLGYFIEVEPPSLGWVSSLNAEALRKWG